MAILKANTRLNKKMIALKIIGHVTLFIYSNL